VNNLDLFCVLVVVVLQKTLLESAKTLNTETKNQPKPNQIKNQIKITNRNRYRTICNLHLHLERS